MMSLIDILFLFLMFRGLYGAIRDLHEVFIRQRRFDHLDDE